MAAVSQMLLITLSMLVIVYMLYSMSWKPIRVLWSWSKLTPMRRITGDWLSGISGTTNLLAFLWASQFFLPVPTSPDGTQSFEISCAWDAPRGQPGE